MTTSNSEPDPAFMAQFYKNLSRTVEERAIPEAERQACDDIPIAGEVLACSDTDNVRIGDGEHAWRDLVRIADAYQK